MNKRTHNTGAESQCRKSQKVSARHLRRTALGDAVIHHSRPATKSLADSIVGEKGKCRVCGYSATFFAHSSAVWFAPSGLDLYHCAVCDVYTIS